MPVYTYSVAGTSTWTPLADGTVTAKALGASGGGGSGLSPAKNNTSGSGSGGGAFSQIVSYSVAYNVGLTVVVGAAGTAGRPGTAGGDSSLVNSSTLLAKGGGAGTLDTPAGAGGLASAGVGSTKYSGGDGSVASATNPGAGGSSAGTGSNGNNASGTTGGAAPTGGFKGADAPASGVGLQGDTPAGAASGGFANQAGGAGRPGWVEITLAATTAIIDAVSNSGYQTAQSTYSWSHTCSESNRFLAVDVEILSVPGTTVTGITYNGIALTLIGVKSTVSGAGRVECWGLVAPATGSNTIAVTLSASVASAGTAASYSGVHQVSPVEAFNSAQATNVGAADATVTITPTTDKCLIHAACATDDTAITANQTSRNNVTGALGSGANEDNNGYVSPAAATAMSYTNVGALATWAIAGYAIRPSTASALGSLPRPLIASQAVNRASTY